MQSRFVVITPDVIGDRCLMAGSRWTVGLNFQNIV